MSGKIRSFTVAALAPVVSPFNLVAHSKLQLGRRLAEALGVAPELVSEVVDALWKGKPVVVTDLGMAVLPGSFPGVSYQALELRASTI